MIDNINIELNYKHPVIGVDEVGRGPLAGPVVAAAVIIDESAIKLGLNDSKKLSPKKRELISESLRRNYKYGIGIVFPEQIDLIGIVPATFLAMRQAVSQIVANDNFDEFQILVDGNQLPFKAPNMECIVKGDGVCASIAAASIIAKVERDKLMHELSLTHPEYLWHKNSGYGTKEHINALRLHGKTIYHRNSFLKFL